MNQQLHIMFNKRCGQLHQLIEYLWDNKKELINKQKQSYDWENYDHGNFHECPEYYIPKYLYKDMSTTMVDKISELLDDGKFTKRYLIDFLMDY